MGEPNSSGASAVPAEQRLVYQGEVFINFRTSRQWVVMKLFALPPDANDDEVLKLLIRHVRYRDSYASRDFKDAKTIHGPYWLHAITPEVFSRASAQDAEALLRTWAEYQAPLPAARRDQMESELYPRIRSATALYQLADLRDTAEHDWGSSVGSDSGFHEFVLIDRRAGSVALVVASDD
ncbi:hypothetical protein BN971_03184 [Mycobacterium bohemicum DSM 44277]|uniref:Uncharacterized protein n=2 Tax=Mycobacterium bohemicum TaxID=56425 RepID=A0A1X1RBW3_MYCBE|nr:hypothetical protein [Mycobacterium bohemicum]MCV6968247.1 hypothetical protein [Mycobacterium bohemicum]ORV02795.1 hypothetical protein AWB93_02995 [Mycobacterium bohemicum]CPR11891.1 hypothetical protein BN971_03184 [Mycobacterium bohemicum DSM 44277]